MTKRDERLSDLEGMLRRSGMTRRQALKVLGLGSVGVAAAPLLARMAHGGEQLKGPGGIPLARPDNPVKLPLHQDPIADGLEPETGGTFNVFNYPEYMDPGLMEKFGEKYDVEVQLTTFDNMDQMTSRLAGGAVDVDVVELLPDRLAQSVAGKLLQPLNHGYVPNLAKNVWDPLQNPFYDVDSQYTVPYMVYSTGITWRSDLVEEDIAELDNPWSIFWNAEDYYGKVGLLNSPREIIYLAMQYRGYFDINTEDPDLIDQAVEDLKALIPICNPRVDIRQYETVPQGSRVLGQTWSGDAVLGSRWYMAEDVSPEVLRYYAGPKGKAPVQNDCWAIPANSNKPVLAHHWLNFLLDETNAFDNFANYLGYLPPIKSIDFDRLREMDMIPENLESAVVTPADFGPDAQVMMTLTTEGLKRYQDGYAEFISGV